LGSGPGSDNRGTGYLTKADYIELVQYADARNIEVIPEIDMPAHAGVVAMEARYNKYKDSDLQKAQEYPSWKRFRTNWWYNGLER
jgi:hexosaminidase